MFPRPNSQRLGVALLPLILAGTASSQTTECTSTNAQGIPGGRPSEHPSISSNGRWVAFTSYSNNLVAGDTNGEQDVFVRDTRTGMTERVSVGSLGQQGNNWSALGSISGDGRYVAFASGADNLAPGVASGTADVFVHDRQTGVTELVSADSLGSPGNNHSTEPALSADGRYVAFSSFANNLVASDTNGLFDVFVHDRQDGSTVRVSVSTSGAEALGNTGSTVPRLSADGRMVAFASNANNLVAGDTNLDVDIFVHDRLQGTTTRVSVDSLGNEANGWSTTPSISADGTHVAFGSWASNLGPGDTNGISDVFVHALASGITERVSLSSGTQQGNGTIGSTNPSLSSGGRHVAFDSWASNLASGDDNGFRDSFVHDRLTGITARVSETSDGQEGDHWSFAPSISADGQFVAFESYARNFVNGDPELDQDIFLHNRWNGQGTNSLFLTGPSSTPTQVPFQLSWDTSHSNSSYWLTFSQNTSGSVFAGHPFDLGGAVRLMDTGVNSPQGTGTYQVSGVPPSLAGLTLYFELGCIGTKGKVYDSNALSMMFN